MEYKYLIAYPELGEVKWESGNNRLVLLVEENVSVSDVPFLDGFGSAMKCELPASVYNKQNGHVEQGKHSGFSTSYKQRNQRSCIQDRKVCSTTF